MGKLGHGVDDKLEHALKVASAMSRVSQRQILEEALAAHPSIKAALQSIETRPDLDTATKRRKAT